MRCSEAIAAIKKSALKGEDGKTICTAAKGDEAIGVDIVLNALSAPIRQIADNGGIDGGVVADTVLEKSNNQGYNAHTGEYVDMFKAGVIDPAKVVRTALANAASIAGLLLTTDAMVSTFDEEDKKKRPIEGAIA